MKRLVWLLLFAFGTALAQVQPVDLPVTKPKASCCGEDCGCGMPKCGLPPAHCPVTYMAEHPAGELRQQARRVTARLPPHPAPHFYLSLVEPAVVVSALRAPSQAPPAASVPLFRAHCSFLL